MRQAGKATPLDQRGRAVHINFFLVKFSFWNENAIPLNLRSDRQFI